MVPIEEALRETLFPKLFRGEEIDADFKTILGHSVKCGLLGIPDPQLSTEIVYNTSNAASGKLVGYILVGTALNYIGHRVCVCRESAGARK